jgi:uncharacterized protein YqeY
LAESALHLKLKDDLKQALRKKDATRTGTLRLLLSAISYAEIDKRGPLDDVGVVGVISKEAKKRRESIEAFKKGNRQDLVSKEEAELAVLLEYMPKQISRDEIVAAAREVIAAVGAKAPSDKGKVMSQLMPKLKGKADGQEISNVVSELLAAPPNP